MSDYLTIDIREWKQKGNELKKEIVNVVKSTQSTIIQPLPDRLIMTPKQYDALQGDPEMHGMYQSDLHVYVTPENAMTVIIEDSLLHE